MRTGRDVAFAPGAAGGIARESVEQASSARWIYRIGAGAVIVGSLAGLVGNFLHPATPIGDPEGTARAVAESQIWLPVHIVIVLGIILMLGGLVAISHSITGGLASALARFGLFAAVAGSTVGTILVILDGVTAKHLADAWAVASPDESAVALQIFLANETANFALASLFNILFAGVTFILYGLAVALSTSYPRWLGWVVVVAGVGSVSAGMIQAFAGESTALSQTLTIIGPTIITLWLVAMGFLLARKGLPVT